MEIRQTKWDNFKLALYQFVMPVTSFGPDGSKVRMEDPSLLGHVDYNILAELESPPKLDGISAQKRPSPHKARRCKNIGPVVRPSSPAHFPMHHQFIIPHHSRHLPR